MGVPCSTRCEGCSATESVSVSSSSSQLVLGTPYLIVGVIWSSTHTDHLAQMDGIDLVVSFLGAIVSWPVLLFAERLHDLNGRHCCTTITTAPFILAS